VESGFFRKRIMIESPDYLTVLKQALRLPPDERIAMIEALAASFREEVKDTDDTPLTLEEVRALSNVNPLTPEQVIAMGLIGSWSHLGIKDGAEWVNQHKAKRQVRRKWSLD
jgi:hypothetical protein